MVSAVSGEDCTTPLVLSVSPAVLGPWQLGTRHTGGVGVKCAHLGLGVRSCAAAGGGVPTCAGVLRDVRMSPGW